MAPPQKFPIESGRTTFGMHLMLDAYEGSEEYLGDMKRIFKFLYSLPEMIGMSRLGLPTVINADETASGFDPGGITGFALINESHISIHTFPKRGFFTMDVYSCSNFEDQVDILLGYATDMFAFEKHDLHIVHRGKAYPVENKHETTDT